jgi:hypothetical protein
VTHQPLPPILIPNAATSSTNQTVPSMLQASFSFGEILANIIIIPLAFLCFLLFNHAKDFWAQRQPLSRFLRIRQNQTEAPNMASDKDETKQGYQRRYRRRRNNRRQKPYPARRRINTAVIKNLPNLFKNSDYDDKSEGPWCTCWSCSYRQDMGDIGPAPEICEKKYNCQCIKCHDKRVTEYNKWQQNFKKTKREMK